MAEVVVLGWCGKALLTTLLVATLLQVMRRFGQRVCGLLTGLPTISAPALLWLAAAEGEHFAALAAMGSVAAGASCALFAWAYGRASRHRRPLPALAAATVLAGLPAPLLVGGPPLGPGLLLAATLAVTVACLAGLRPARASRTGQQAGCVPSHIGLTAGVAGLVSGGVGLLAGELGPFWSGAVASAPLVAAIVGLRVHADCGPPAVQRFMHAYCGGLAVRSLLTATFGVLLPVLGGMPAMLVSCIAAVAGWAMLSAWRAWWQALRADNERCVVVPGS